MPQIHHREKLVTEAELKIEAAVTEAVKDLTPAEYLRVLNSVFSGRLSQMAKQAIREERHPENPDRPGGWE